MKKKDRIEPRKNQQHELQQSPSPPPAYAPPKVTTYTSGEILEAIGPAQACSPSPCPVGN